MNDRDRAEWVENDESLYLDRRRSRLSVAEYVRHNRQSIDAAIRALRRYSGTIGRRAHGEQGNRAHPR